MVERFEQEENLLVQESFSSAFMFAAYVAMSPKCFLNDPSVPVLDSNPGQNGFEFAKQSITGTRHCRHTHRMLILRTFVQVA